MNRSWAMLAVDFDLITHFLLYDIHAGEDSAGEPNQPPDGLLLPGPPVHPVM